MFFNSDSAYQIEQLQLKVAALEKVVEQLSERAGIEGPKKFGPPISDEVRRLVGQGKAIAAIKQLREETGLGLRAAKEVVDKLQSGEIR